MGANIIKELLMKKKSILVSIFLLIALVVSINAASAAETVDDYGVEIIAT